MQNKNKDPAAAFLIALFRTISGFFKSVFGGVRRLNRPAVLIGFALTGAATVCAYLNKSHILTPIHRPADGDITATLYVPKLDALMSPLPVPARYALYWTSLLLPLFYFAVVGRIYAAKAEKYYRLFAEIEFKGKNGKYPYFLGRKKDGYKDIYLFKSAIPVSEWRKAVDRLETALDCSVRRVEPDEKSKKTVRLITVSGRPVNRGNKTPF